MPTEISPSALLDLQTALSPAFPVGAFSYSHGLERAVHDGLVADADGLAAWLRDLIEHGSGWNDAVLFAAAWRGEEVSELALALAPSLERWRETALQGEAFGSAAEVWGAEPSDALPYPVAVGRFAASRGLPLEASLAAMLHAFAANLVQAALRLMRLGQTGGLRVLASLKSLVLETAARAARSTLDDLGSAAILSDIASLRHETQYSRIFRS